MRRGVGKQARSPAVQDANLDPRVDAGRRPRLAHRDAGGNRPLYLGHPEFEGFEVIQTVAPPAAVAAK